MNEKPDDLLCSFSSCKRQSFATGLCKTHYAQQYRGKELADIKKSIVIAPEYRMHRRLWWRMKTRCYNTGYLRYKDYGGRGIKICDRWLNSFPDFCKDIGKQPGPEYSLDRIDNNGDYTPENCRWATKSIQGFNRRKTNTSGVAGVRWHKRDNRWVARIIHNYKTISLGYYRYFDDAVAARKEAERLYFPEVVKHYED